MFAPSPSWRAAKRETSPRWSSRLDIAIQRVEEPEQLVEGLLVVPLIQKFSKAGLSEVPSRRMTSGLAIRVAEMRLANR